MRSVKLKKSNLSSTNFLNTFLMNPTMSLRQEATISSIRYLIVGLNIRNISPNDRTVNPLLGRRAGLTAFLNHTKYSSTQVHDIRSSISDLEYPEKIWYEVIEKH